MVKTTNTTFKWTRYKWNEYPASGNIPALGINEKTENVATSLKKVKQMECTNPPPMVTRIPRQTQSRSTPAANDKTLRHLALDRKSRPAFLTYMSII